MNRCWGIGVTLGLAAGAVIWALVGLPGEPAGCLLAGCDCEAVGPGPIRQPANAWSSLALTATGLFLAIASPGHGRGRREGRRTERREQLPAGPSPGETRSRSERRGGSHARGSARRAVLPSPQSPPRSRGWLPLALPPAPSPRSRKGEPARRPRAHALTREVVATALVAAGLGAFLYHAGLTAWAARLDGITVAVLVAALALHTITRAATAQRPRGGLPGISRRRLVPWPLLALGAVCWWLGQTGGAWCRSDGWLPAHAAWHLLAAAAIGLWLSDPVAGPAKRPASPDAA